LNDWPPTHNVIDRDDDVAISQFSPVPRPSRTTTCTLLSVSSNIGDAETTKAIARSLTGPNPLDEGRVEVGVCRSCQALVEGEDLDRARQTGSCPSALSDR